MELSKLPNNKHPNTSAFKNWWTTIEDKLDQKNSTYVISDIGYILCRTKAPVCYGSVDQDKNQLDHWKYIKRLKGKNYQQDKNLVYAKIRRAWADCGLTWIDKYKITKDVRHELEDLKKYYYV